MAGSSSDSPFGCIQLEYGFLLGPPDGRYLVRSPGGEEIENVLALATLGAPPRRTLRGRKGSLSEDASVEAEPVPTSRATVIRAEPFDRVERAEAWLTRLRAEPDDLDAEVRDAVRTVNRALSAYRTATANPYRRDVDRAGALVVRVGYGSGEAVADGRFGKVWELPRAKSKVARSMATPDERFAAVLGGREKALACEELVLRARDDLTAGRRREAALQARAALETLLAEIPRLAERRRVALDADVEPVQEAAQHALTAEPSPEAMEAVVECVGRMEAALRAFHAGLTS